MRKKKMLFIYNPCAGKGAMKSKLSDVMETFMRADYEVTVYATGRLSAGIFINPCVTS